MNKNMLAAVFEGNGKLSLKEVPVPKIAKANEVLIEVEACGICGSDLHALDVPPRHPATQGVILGHEYVGRIIEVGPEVVELKVGDRVIDNPDVYCGVCEPCRNGRLNQCEHFSTLGIYIDGGFAEYNVSPEQALFKIPDELPVKQAALIELMRCIVNGTNKLRFKPGNTVAVFGGGPAGLMFMLVAKAMGAGKVIVTEVAPYRQELAGRMGADLVIDASKQNAVERIIEATGGEGADVTVDSVGYLISEAVSAAAKGGQVLLFGVDQDGHQDIHQYTIVRRELTVMGSFSGVNTVPAAIKMITSGKVDTSVLVTHTLPLNRIHEGIDLLRAGEAMKIVVVP
jgi:(R,R)-butanediol dehydrogenase/meso-butanediol dehydrogenase/diacetyl reductase